MGHHRWRRVREDLEQTLPVLEVVYGNYSGSALVQETAIAVDIRVQLCMQGGFAASSMVLTLGKPIERWREK